MVENIGFRGLVETFEPGYTMPHRTYFSETWIPNKYDETFAEMKEIVSAQEFLAFTTDIWSDRAQDGFISLTCHFIDEDMYRNSAALNMKLFNESHTAENISSELTECVKLWDIKRESVQMFLRDNASNMKAGIRVADFPANSCLPHDLQLVLNDALFNQEPISEMISNFKHLVTHYKHSNVATQSLLRVQCDMGVKQPLKMVQEVPTRWFSKYSVACQACPALVKASIVISI